MGTISNYFITTGSEIKERIKTPLPLEYVKEQLTVIPRQNGNDEVFPMITYKIVGDTWYVPYKWGKDNFPCDKTDVSIGAPIDLTMNPEYSPRSDQIQFLDDAYDALNTVERFRAAGNPGFGKTFCGISLICKMNMTTAIIVGKTMLIDQWRSELLKFTDIDENDIGLIKADVVDYENKKIVLISTDSFYDRDFDESFLRQFGFLLLDEGHNFNSQKKFATFGKLYAKYQMSLSATHDRVDGRDEVSRLWFGDIEVSATDADPVPIDVVLVPVKHDDMIYINTKWFIEKNIDPRWAEISKLSQLEFRNVIALNLIKKQYDENYYSLCVSDRVEQLQEYYKRLIEMGVPEDQIGLAVRSSYTGNFKISLSINAENINDYKNAIKDYDDGIKYTISASRVSARGFSSKKKANDFYEHVRLILSGVCNVIKKEPTKDKKSLQDDEVYAIIKNKKYKIILASYGLLKEGVSIWWMSRLFDLTPQSRAEQLLGRIGRKAEDGGEKDAPVCYSLWDYGNVSNRLQSVHRNRLANYKKLSYVTVKRMAVKSGFN